MKCCGCGRAIENTPELPMPTLCPDCLDKQFDSALGRRLAKMSDDDLMERLVEHRVPEKKLDEHCFEILPRGRANILKAIRDKGGKLVDVGYVPTAVRGFHNRAVVYKKFKNKGK